MIHFPLELNHLRENTTTAYKKHIFQLGFFSAQLWWSAEQIKAYIAQWPCFTGRYCQNMVAPSHHNLSARILITGLGKITCTRTLSWYQIVCMRHISSHQCLWARAGIYIYMKWHTPLPWSFHSPILFLWFLSLLNQSNQTHSVHLALLYIMLSVFPCWWWFSLPACSNIILHLNQLHIANKIPTCDHAPNLLT